MFLTFDHVDIEEFSFSWSYFCFPDEISNSKFWNLKIKKKWKKLFFDQKVFSKLFSSVNTPNMEKIHTLKKICFDLKISFFNFLCARAGGARTSPKNAFFDFFDSYATYFGAQRVRNRARHHKMCTNRFSWSNRSDLHHKSLS